MKKISLFLILVTSILFFNCIGEDIRQDEVSEELRILNPTQNILITENYTFNASFFNNIGEIDNSTTIMWSSGNALVATIDNTGLLTPQAEGSVIITASVENEAGAIIETAIPVTITLELVETDLNPVSKTGTIVTTSSYRLEGDFTISEIENTDNILISIANNYRATTSLPGLYIYLSNNPNSINGALELGAVTKFSGAHTYTVNNTNITDFAYILYWCKPFGIKVGEGKINN